MPDLTGRKYEEGGRLLVEALRAARNDNAIQARTRITRSAPPGTYVDQKPAAGTPLRPETVVRVFVATDR